MTNNYRALTLLWHTKAEMYVQPGEVVDLSHLVAEQIEYLVKLGAIEFIAPEHQDKQEVKDDATSIGS